jgi:hypothetical protein
MISSRMDGWASDLDLTFKRLTDGETDITGASQLEYVRLKHKIKTIIANILKLKFCFDH